MVIFIPKESNWYVYAWEVEISAATSFPKVMQQVEQVAQR